MTLAFVFTRKKKKSFGPSEFDSDACNAYACLPEMKYTAGSIKLIWSTFVSVSLCTPACDHIPAPWLTLLDFTLQALEPGNP